VLREQQPYFTFEGLVRLTRHVLLAFVDRQEVLEHENHPNWRSELSGILRLPWAPQYWISRADSLKPELASRYFSGLLQHLVSQFSLENWMCPDMSAVLTRIEDLMPSCPEKHQQTLAWLYFLCCWRHPELNDKCVGFYKRYEQCCGPCTIEGLSIWALTTEPLRWDLLECEAVYDAYLRQRHKPGNTHLPVQVDVAIAAGIANAHLTGGRTQESSIWMRRAILDGAGMPQVQKHLAICGERGSTVNLQAVLGIEPLVSTNAGS
jgi:hypothetical protein